MTKRDVLIPQDVPARTFPVCYSIPSSNYTRFHPDHLFLSRRLFFRTFLYTIYIYIQIILYTTVRFCSRPTVFWGKDFCRAHLDARKRYSSFPSKYNIAFADTTAVRRIRGQRYKKVKSRQFVL